jgi:hypothetical protein
MSMVCQLASSSSASACRASASAEVNAPDSADSASSPITGSTSATRGRSVTACLPARIAAARQTSPSEPATDSGGMVSALFSTAIALTGPASRPAVAAVKARNVSWSSARTVCVKT